jgi:hypothetical protein
MQIPSSDTQIPSSDPQIPSSDMQVLSSNSLHPVLVCVIYTNVNVMQKTRAY